jgi:precorrin-2 dehydrogenase/sirohydrochlorin ferrochelatase
LDVFPAFYPLAGRRVGLAGEGEGLQARRRLLSGSPAELVILDAAAAVSPDAWAGMALGFIAHPDEAFSRQAADAARRAGAPVNVMDRPALCDFTVPALIDRGALVAAFGTGGASPLIAARLRAEMESRIPEGLGRLARFLEDNKAGLRARYPDCWRVRSPSRSSRGAPTPTSRPFWPRRSPARRGPGDGSSPRPATRRRTSCPSGPCGSCRRRTSW